MWNQVKKYYEEIGMFVILTGIYYLLSIGGMLKYAVVLAVTAVVFLIQVLIRKKRIPRIKFCILLPAAVYIVWGGVVGAVRGNLNYYSFKQAMFFLIPGIAAIVISEFLTAKQLEKFIYVQFWAITAAFFIVHHNFTARDWLESSYYAFILGAYVIFFLYKKNWLHMAAALAVFLLSHKRTVWGGAAVCCIWLVLALWLQRKNEKWAKLYVAISWAAAIAVLFAYVYVCYLGSSWGKVQLDSGVTWGALEQMIPINTENRIWAWSHFIGLYNFTPAYLGQGFGFVLTKLAEWVIAGPYYLNLHNDFLAAYIELGMIGYLVWLLSYRTRFQLMTKKNKQHQTILSALVFYGFINSMANNMLIHIPYLLPLFFIYLHFMKEEPGGISDEPDLQQKK